MNQSDSKQSNPSAAKEKSAAPPKRQANPKPADNARKASTDGNRQRGVIVAPTPK